MSRKKKLSTFQIFSSSKILISYVLRNLELVTLIQKNQRALCLLHTVSKSWTLLQPARYRGALPNPDKLVSTYTGSNSSSTLQPNKKFSFPHPSPHKHKIHITCILQNWIIIIIRAKHKIPNKIPHPDSLLFQETNHLIQTKYIETKQNVARYLSSNNDSQRLNQSHNNQKTKKQIKCLWFCITVQQIG
jgi:hypothetical protein